MYLSDSLNVELYNDNLKMFNQAWEETVLASGKDFYELVLEILYERQVKNVCTHEARDDFISARHCSDKGAEKPPKIEDCGE